MGFQVYHFKSESTVHVVMTSFKSGKSLVIQSAAIYKGVARIFGTMRQPWWSFWLTGQVKADKVKSEFLKRFEKECRKAGAVSMEGAVPPKIWNKSYAKWTGFELTGETEPSRHGRLLKVRKVL